MMPPDLALDETHDPATHSWIEPANDPDCDFPIQNLPFGVFRPAVMRRPSSPRVGVRIGDLVLDVLGALEEGLLTGVGRSTAEALAAPALNGLMARPGDERLVLRRVLHAALSSKAPADRRRALEAHLLPLPDLELLLPAVIGDYTDFYASVFHATNVGSMFRPDNPLLPNYKHVPIGYHGRASSIVVSGTPVRRPAGQTRPEGADHPLFGPSLRLDHELEVGAFVAEGNPLGAPIPIAGAEARLFGLCLVNDWSARDIQQWEYQPLGPFLAKSFATTISPWVITLEALAPFRVPAFRRPEGDPEPLPYLRSPRDSERGGFDLHLEVGLTSRAMREAGMEPHLVSRGNFQSMYWTFAQMLTHHASNGCNLRPGDLIASGTVSGPEEESRGCLLERTWRGTHPVTLPSGELRRFLEDGDEVTLRGWCERAGARRIGLGECRGRIDPAAFPAD